jgi:Tol biopolymer transport system component
MAAVDQEPIYPPRAAVRFPHLTSLDRAVMVVVVALIALIGGTVLLGDRVGVQITQIEPNDASAAHTTSPITIKFSEAMNHESVMAHFHTDPALQGTFSWNRTMLTFQANTALQPGNTYTVALDAGALSADGRALLADYRSRFTVAHPRVAFLAPADGKSPNVWIVDPADLEHPAQVTQSPTGIEDFGVSPDGQKIAFTENSADRATSDIKLIDLTTGALEQLTNCQNSACSAPVWRPDGKMIVYQRVENDPQFGNSPPRIWLLDLTTHPATTRPLFQETQILGYQAQWSADGNRIAFVNRGSVAIDIYDLTTDKIVQIDSTAGVSGALSPDGKQLIYPDLVADHSGSGAMLNKLRLFTIDTGEFVSLSDDDTQSDDQRAQWSPDGKQVAIARMSGGSGVRGLQVYLMDVATKQTKMLTDDPRYSNLAFWWDPTGTALLIQRFPEVDAQLQTDPNALPEIWTLDVASGESVMVASNGFLPRWVP